MGEKIIIDNYWLYLTGFDTYRVDMPDGFKTHISVVRTATEVIPEIWPNGATDAAKRLHAHARAYIINKVKNDPGQPHTGNLLKSGHLQVEYLDENNRRFVLKVPLLGYEVVASTPELLLLQKDHRVELVPYSEHGLREWMNPEPPHRSGDIFTEDGIKIYTTGRY